MLTIINAVNASSNCVKYSRLIRDYVKRRMHGWIDGWIFKGLSVHFKKLWARGVKQPSERSTSVPDVFPD